MILMINVLNSAIGQKVTLAHQKCAIADFADKVF